MPVQVTLVNMVCVLHTLELGTSVTVPKDIQVQPVQLVFKITYISTQCASHTLQC